MVPNNKDSIKDSALDVQVGGNHYKNYKIQPIEFLYHNDMPFIEGCVIKYICRYNKKGTPIEDLKKIKHYVDILIEKEKEKKYDCSDAGHPQTQPERSRQGMYEGRIDWNTYLRDRLYGME